MALQKLFGQEKAARFLQTIYDETITLFASIGTEYGGGLRNGEEKNPDKEFGPVDLISNFKDDTARVFIGRSCYGPQYDELTIKTKKDRYTKLKISIKFGWLGDSHEFGRKLISINELISQASSLQQALKLRWIPIYRATSDEHLSVIAKDCSIVVVGTGIGDIAPSITINIGIYNAQ